MATTQRRGNTAAAHLRSVPETAHETPQEVGSIPARQKRCRAGHHRFPLDDWLPGEEPVPRGVSVMPSTEGRLKLVEPCTACQAVTGVTHTHPGGVFDGYLPRQIYYGKSWVKLDRDVPRSRRVMRDSRYQGQAASEQIKELLGRVVTLVDDDDTGRPVVPVVFREA
jgi:hypothetical protein